MVPSLSISEPDKTCLVTFRFPQVDPAGIGFYPRYFEMVSRYFPDAPFLRYPAAIKTQFLKPNRFGDQISLSFERDSDSWSITGRMNGDDYFSMRPLQQGAALTSDACQDLTATFSTCAERVGDWASNGNGRMHLSRYFEFLNTAIEEWFEDTLDTPFHELHVDRKIGIPTVQFNTRIRELPRSEDEISIRFQPTKIGQRAMTFKSWLVSGDQCFVENEQVIVFVRMLAAGYESIPIPDYIREKFLEQLEISAVEK